MGQKWSKRNHQQKRKFWLVVPFARANHFAVTAFLTHTPYVKGPLLATDGYESKLSQDIDRNFDPRQNILFRRSQGGGGHQDLRDGGGVPGLRAGAVLRVLHAPRGKGRGGMGRGGEGWGERGDGKGPEKGSGGPGAPVAILLFLPLFFFCLFPVHYCFQFHSFQGFESFEETIKNPGETDPVFEKNDPGSPVVIVSFRGALLYPKNDRNSD